MDGVRSAWFTIGVKPLLLYLYLVRELEAYSHLTHRVDSSTPKEVASATSAKLRAKYPSHPTLDTLETPELIIPLTPISVSSKPDQEWHVKISITVSRVIAYTSVG